MAKFAVYVHPRVFKELRAVEKAGRRDVVIRAREAFRRLEEDPVASRTGVDILPMKGPDPRMYRLRIGKYRILYFVDLGTREVFVARLFRRRDEYPS